MIDQILYLMGNLVGSCKEIKARIMKDFDLIQLMASTIESKTQKGQKIPKEIAKNFVWVAYNISKDPKDLS